MSLPRKAKLLISFSSPLLSRRLNVLLLTFESALDRPIDAAISKHMSLVASIENGKGYRPLISQHSEMRITEASASWRPIGDSESRCDRVPDRRADDGRC